LQGISLCWVEEAEKVSSDSWDILIPTIREEDSEILISFNPESEDSPVLKRFVYTNRDDYIAEKLNYDDNELFPAVLRREMEYDKSHDTEKYMYVWEGNPKRYGQAVIFKNKISVEEFAEPPETQQYYVGIDFGFSTDALAIAQMFIKDMTLYIDHDFYGHGIEIEQIPQALNTLPAVCKGFHIMADSARPDTISHLQNKGYNIDGAEKGKDSVTDGIEFLRSFQAIIIHPRCKGSIGDFENYRWKQDKITGEILPIPLDKSNHIPDACRYALESYIKGGLSIFEAMPKLDEPSIFDTMPK
jgi:phage terminase large subunit